MKRKTWFIIIGLGFLGLGILSLRPVPTPAEEECVTVEGSVAEIYGAGTRDVVFALKGKDKIFYVNRGLERGLDLDTLRRLLMNQQITIKYPKHWTPLDPFNLRRHISKIEYGGETIFTELDEN